MRLVDTDAEPGFRVHAGTERSQAATMVLEPGERTGGPSNRHEDSDQWLYVSSGSGTAVIDGDEHELAPGTLALIEAGETHEIRNDGDHPLETVSVYAPPTY